MSRSARKEFLSGYIYHLYGRGNNKNVIFRDSGDKEIWQHRLILYSKAENVEIVASCIMDNHYHLAIKILNNSDVPKFMQRLCTGYAMYFNKKYHHVGHVFQSRYQSKIMESEKDVINLLEYISNNPVEKGFCDIPENYAWLWIKGTDLTKDSPQK